jgi:hypothetical protein
MTGRWEKRVDSFQKAYRKMGLAGRQAVIREMEDFVAEVKMMLDQLEE